jgi:hypothetical protein
MPYEPAAQPTAQARLLFWNPAPFTEPLSGETSMVAMPADWTPAMFLEAFTELNRQIQAEEGRLVNFAGHYVRPYQIERATLEISYVGRS